MKTQSLTMSLALLSAAFISGFQEQESASVAHSKIAFVTSRDGKGEIYVINPDGSGLTNLTDNPAEDFAPAWSPDGSKIAFRSHRGEGFYNLYVMDADGSNQIRLVQNSGDDPAGDFRPSWSPDGSKIVFNSNREGVRYRGIYVVNVDGSNLTNLTTSGSAPRWSPDGSKIAFELGRDIYVRNADGSNHTRLAEGVRPAWSPDGSKIAFSAITESTFEIYLMNADGSDPNSLTRGSVPAFLPSWSPDGLKIAFKTMREDDPELFLEVLVMNADGSNQTRLSGQVAFDPRQVEPLSWSPDGTKIVFARTDLPFTEVLRVSRKGNLSDVNFDIYIVNIDGSDLLRLTTHSSGESAPVWSPMMK